MNPLWLMRMYRWARNPPSLRKVVVVGVIVGLCLLVAAVEYLGYWPEALTLDRKPGRIPKF